MYAELSEAERFPLLTCRGRERLHAMRQHPRAPIWNWPNGEQLNESGLARVEQFAAQLHAQPVLQGARAPEWLSDFTEFCLEEVPFHRRRSAPGTPFGAVPSCCRADLAAGVWDFVPDNQPLDELIVFSSSGTTGHPMQTPTHPAAAACGIPLIERAMASLGIRFPRGPERMALTNVAAYPGAYTTAIVVAYLREAGCVRVNLDPGAWRNEADCPAFLDDLWAPVMLGDPQAFAALEGVPIQRPPQVLVSSILRLSDGLAERLVARYGCPVVDLYALTEAGIVAVKTAQGHAVLPHDLYVEVLDEHDVPCAPGKRGEVTLTGGRNPFLPLLRYRTGDFACLSWHDGRPVLRDLEGRGPVGFPIGDRVVHSMEVTRLLRPYALTQYQLHQDAEGGFRFAYRGAVNERELREALTELLGRPPRLVVEHLPPPMTGRQGAPVYQSLHPRASAPTG